MVEGIEGAYNIRIYNRYISLGRWVEQEALKATAYYYNSQSAVRGYLWAVSNSYIAEEYLSEQNRAPLIMTRDEYEKAVKDALENT